VPPSLAANKHNIPLYWAVGFLNAPLSKVATSLAIFDGGPSVKLNLGAGGAAGIKEDWNGSGGIVLLGSSSSSSSSSSIFIDRPAL